MRSLSTYRHKRDFEKTREPRGAPRRENGFSYVIQKHAARRLHYDFRLELDGVLLSWAVPKGPSLDPKVRRLAQQTEDHPLEYGGFEGTIPKGEYGGGTVMLWDRGSWEPEGDAREQYKKGRLTFELHGERLSGRWHLVRTGRDPGKSWLLFKGRDERARDDGDTLLEEAVTSVASRRTMDEIASGSSARTQGRATSRASKSIKTTKVSTKTTKVSAAPKSARRPRTTTSLAISEPELATLVDRVPEGDDWLHEIKFDGYRILARVADGEVRLITRNGNDWTERLPALADAFGKLKVRTALLDGELVVFGENGLTSFQRLQNALGSAEPVPLVYCAFDLLELDGEDLRELPLEERKAHLQRLIGSGRAPKTLEELVPGDGGTLRFSQHVIGRGAEVFRAACALGLEGIVAKRRSAPYRSGRGKNWLKIKCQKEQEFVIGGYTAPEGGRKHLGALLVGVWKDGALMYSGKVGTGFTERSLAELEAELAPLRRRDSPFTDVPRAVARGVRWVEPERVAQVAFTEITDGHRLRHPSFRGLRDDKPSLKVELERAQPVRAAAQEKVSGVALTNPDKLLYPEDGISKRDVYDYYSVVAELMLPHVVDRPLMLRRCPNGWNRPCFFQKHVDKGRPPELRAVRIAEKSGSDEYLVVDDARGIAALAQLGALEIHTWGSRAAKVEKPDLVVLDIDPDPALPFADVAETAELLRRLFDSLGLEAFLKTTGGKGLHVCVPIVPRLEWAQVKSFSQDVAESLAALAPERYLAVANKAKRKGKIFIDYLRNGRGATFVAPYSTRARAGAPVAMPITWAELPKLRGSEFTLETVPDYLASRKRDPWAALLSTRQALTAAAIRSVAAAARKS